MKLIKRGSHLGLSLLLLSTLFFNMAQGAGMPPPEKEPVVEETIVDEEKSGAEKKKDSDKQSSKETAKEKLLEKNGLTFSLKDEKRIAAGKDIFFSTCADYCHGQQPELFINRTGLDEMYVFETIRDGGKGATPMPEWGGVFSKEEIWELVAYVKSLGKW